MRENVPESFAVNPANSEVLSIILFLILFQDNFYAALTLCDPKTATRRSNVRVILLQAPSSLGQNPPNQNSGE